MTHARFYILIEATEHLHYGRDEVPAPCYKVVTAALVFLTIIVGTRFPGEPASL